MIYGYLKVNTLHKVKNKKRAHAQIKSKNPVLKT